MEIVNLFPSSYRAKKVWGWSESNDWASLENESAFRFPHLTEYELGYCEELDCRQSLIRSADFHMAVNTTTDKSSDVRLNIGAREGIGGYNHRNPRFEAGFILTLYDREDDQSWDETLTGFYTGIYLPKITERISFTLLPYERIGGILSFDAGLRVGVEDILSTDKNWFASTVIGFDVNFSNFRLFAAHNYTYQRETEEFSDGIEIGFKINSSF